MSKFKLGSLFDGIGGFPIIAQMYDIEPVWASEIEEAPIRITKKHFPNMKHLGDITKINGAEIEPVDIITGGSPCTDLSVAGRQEGISKKCPECGKVLPINFEDGICPKCGAEIELTRSGLFMEQIRIIKEMREATNGKYPRYVVWENVKGAFSSNNGDDFFCVLKEFCGLLSEELPTLRPPKWTAAGEILGTSGSLAWRTFDAQYWGVPQRRTRIYLVADLGGHSVREILFKPESLRRHSPKGEVSWKTATRKTEESLRGSDEQKQGIMCVATQQPNAEIMIDKSPTLTAANGMSGSNKPFIVEPQCGAFLGKSGENTRSIGYSETASPTLTAGEPPQVAVYDDKPTVYGICSKASNCMKSDNPDSGVYEATVSKTLDTSGLNPTCNQGGNVVVDPVYCIQGNCIDRSDTAGCNGKGWREDVAFTLTTTDRPAVVYGVHEGSGGEVHIAEELSNCMTTGGGKPGQGFPCVFIDDQATEKSSAAFAYQAGPNNPHLPYNEELSPTLTSCQKMAVMIENHPADSRVRISEDGICQTLSARMGTGGGNVPLVMESEAESREPIVMGSTGNFMRWDEGISPTLCAGDYRVHNKVVCTEDKDPNSYAVTNCSHTDIGVNVSPPLAARDYKDPHLVSSPKTIVRRLTPLEAERLQGFPDFYTASESDAARYKALGNSVALPCVDYVISGIIDELDPEIST